MIFIGMGSNVGNPAANLDEALKLMANQRALPLRVSGYYRTAAWGDEDQPDFLNAVCEVEWEGSPAGLMSRLLIVEKKMGRERTRKWGPRLIDLDLLEFNRRVVHLPDLMVPHPWYPQRDFVLAPFMELEPDWVPTGGRQTVSALYEGITHAGRPLPQRI